MLEINVNGQKAFVIDDENRTTVFDKEIAAAIDKAHVNSDTIPAYTLTDTISQTGAQEN